MSHSISQLEIAIPPYFLCPISFELMRDPVTLSSGQTFDRSSIEKWRDDGHTTCPITRQALPIEEEVIPNHVLRRMIQGWCVANSSKGVERIATPRQPVSLREIRQLVDDLRLGDLEIGALKKVNGLAKEHLRTRKQLLQSGVLAVLASSLTSSLLHFPRRSSSVDCLSPRRSEIAEEILSILSCLCESENVSNFWYPTSGQLSSIAWFLAKGTLDSKLNAAMLLNSLHISRDLIREIGGQEGLIESVLDLIKDTMYPKASLAGLKLLLDLCSSIGNRTRAMEAGVVDTLVELLPGADKRSVEAALAVLAALCHSADGRASFTRHALSFPVTVKILNSVSSRATEAALQTLFAVLNSPACTSAVKKAAAQAGAVVQLVMVTQRDSSGFSKRTALQVLKALREVIDSDSCRIDLNLLMH